MNMTVHYVRRPFGFARSRTDSGAHCSAPTVPRQLRLNRCRVGQAGFRGSAQAGHGHVGSPEAHEVVVSGRHKLSICTARDRKKIRESATRGMPVSGEN